MMKRNHNKKRHED